MSFPRTVLVAVMACALMYLMTSVNAGDKVSDPASNNGTAKNDTDARFYGMPSWGGWSSWSYGGMPWGGMWGMPWGGIWGK